MRGLESLCFDMLSFVRFLYFVIFRYKGFHNPFKKKYSGTIAVLANGPSLNEILPHLEKNEEFENIDFCVVNYFAFSDCFIKIKPKHYCLMDGIFFRPILGDHEQNKIRELFSVLQNSVDWQLNLYIPKIQYCNFLEYSRITNSNISIIKMNCSPFNIYNKNLKSVVNYLYAKGLAIPAVKNVSIVAIYVSINSGYKNILLYGVDHTFMTMLVVDENNRLFFKSNHFYPEQKQLIPKIKSGIWLKVSEELSDLAGAFKSHEMLADFANSRKINVINCTQNSMIDSYKRIPQDEIPYDIENILGKYLKWQ